MLHLLSSACSATEMLFWGFLAYHPLELITLQDSIKFFKQSCVVCRMLDRCHHVCVLSTTLFKHPAFVRNLHFVRLFIGYAMIKGKVQPTTGHEGPEGEQMYSSTLPLNFALEGGGWSMPHPGRFTPPCERPHCIGGWVGPRARRRKSRPPPVFDPRTIQPIASRYTDCAIPTPSSSLMNFPFFGGWGVRGDESLWGSH